MNEFSRRFLIPAGFIAAICGSGLSSAAAQPSETEAVDAAIACRDVAEDLERLACLDAATETLVVTRIIREEATEEKNREERTFFGLGKRKQKDDDSDPLVAQSPEDFGGEYLPENIKKRDKKRLKEISVKIAEIRVNPYGKVTLTLENGQVWRQLNSDNKTLYFSKKEKLYTAKVKRSTFGNYLMTVKEMGRTIRVRRIE